MHFYIDGYNAIFRLMGTSTRSIADLREDLLNILLEWKKPSIDRLTVVFDAHLQTELLQKMHLDHIEIYFSSSGETADTLIVKLLERKKNLQQVTVVTSDKVLAKHAAHSGAHTQTIEYFFQLIQKKKAGKQKKLKETASRFRLAEYQRWLILFEKRERDGA